MVPGLFRILLAVAIASIFVRSGPAGEVPTPDEFAGVQEYIKKALADRIAPSVAVGVLRNERIVWAQGFGHAVLDTETKATADSIYRLASISKPITATGLMILKDRGLIELDKPANDYLAGQKLRSPFGDAHQMTIRRLANHTSGLPIHYTFFYHGVRPYSMDEAIRRYGFASKKPGSEWEYSNLGFGILNHITEVVAKEPWSRFMVREVYDPLGMTRTYDGVRPGRESDATAQYTHDVGGRFVRIPFYDFDHPGASAVWSSVHDMLRFARMHLQEGDLDGARILSALAAREMKTPTSSRPGRKYGVAWAIDTTHGQQCISHSGGMPGVSTQLRLFPEHRTATVVLTNCDRRTMTNEVTRRIAEVLFPNGGRNASSESSPQTGDPARLTGRWTGTLTHYDGDLSLAIRVRDAETVEVRFNDQRPRRLENVRFVGDRLFGFIEARLRTLPDYVGTVRLQFRLRANGKRLTGVAVALAPAHFALSHWVDLHRMGKSKSPKEEAGNRADSRKD